jgi:hypothetical protein
MRHPKQAQLVPILALAASQLACPSYRLTPASSAALTSSAIPGAGGAFDGVRIEAFAEAWRDLPRDLTDRSTPIFLVIENRRPAAITIAREDFSLVTGQPIFPALAPDAAAGHPVSASADELELGEIPAGETRHGFVYFQRVVGWYKFVDLRMRLADATSAEPFTTAVVRFVQARPDWCRERPPDDVTTRGAFFDTCLPPW